MNFYICFLFHNIKLNKEIENCKGNQFIINRKIVMFMFVMWNICPSLNMSKLFSYFFHIFQVSFCNNKTIEGKCFKMVEMNCTKVAKVIKYPFFSDFLSDGFPNYFILIFALQNNPHCKYILLVVLLELGKGRGPFWSAGSRKS